MAEAICLVIDVGASASRQLPIQNGGQNGLQNGNAHENSKSFLQASLGKYFYFFLYKKRFSNLSSLFSKALNKNYIGILVQIFFKKIKNKNIPILECASLFVERKLFKETKVSIK